MYTSFSETRRGATKFGTPYKVKISDLQALKVRILYPEDVAADMKARGLKQSRINEVLENMRQNDEVLVQGQIPGYLVKKAK